MRICLLFPLLGLVVAPALAQSGAGYFPLEEGNRWVWFGGEPNEPDLYYRLEVTGDTLIGGAPYALVTTTTLLQVYQPVSTAYCAVRVTPHWSGIGEQVEAVRLRGGFQCLPPAVGNGEAPDIGPGPGEPMTVEIGGISYTFDDVVVQRQVLPLIGNGEEHFAAGVGPLYAHFAVNLSQGGGRARSALVYAEVGGAVYGVEPTPGDSPAPARFYPLAPGDVWVYDVTRYGDLDWVERRVVLRDTLIAGVPFALLDLTRYDPATYEVVDEARCAARFAGETGGIEWRSVQGDCAVPDAAFDAEGWWVPLTETEWVEPDCAYAIGGQPYTLPFCFRIYDALPDPPISVSVVFGADVGLVSYEVHDVDTDVDGRLVYAEVGGAVYGADPVAAEPPPGAPHALRVERVHPNPFRESAAIALTLPESEAVGIALYDALGRRAWSRDWGQLPAGRHALPLDGSALAPGVYVVRVRAGAEAATWRVVRTE